MERWGNGLLFAGLVTMLVNVVILLLGKPGTRMATAEALAIGASALAAGGWLLLVWKDW